MTIRRGITRTVFLVGRWAIKVPSLRAHGGGWRGRLWSLAQGVLANQSEATWSYDGDPAEPICPVRASLLGGLINVYPRCEPVLPDAAGDYPEPRMAILLPPNDRKPQNLGWLAGELVWVDYAVTFNGCPHDWAGTRAARDEQDEIEALIGVVSR